jgi:hypothetical protein
MKKKQSEGAPDEKGRWGQMIEELGDLLRWGLARKKRL